MKRLPSKRDLTRKVATIGAREGQHGSYISDVSFLNTEIIESINKTLQEYSKWAADYTRWTTMETVHSVGRSDARTKNRNNGSIADHVPR